METDRCPTCGTLVEIVSSNEGTCYYRPQQEPEGDGLVEVLVAAWSDDSDLQVGVPYRRMASQAAQIVRARAQPQRVSRERLRHALERWVGNSPVTDSSAQAFADLLGIEITLTKENGEY